MGEGKGMVDESKLPPLPEYEYFSNGEYLNPQTHPVYTFLRDNHFSWFHEFDYKFVKKDNKEITLLGIQKDLYYIIYDEGTNHIDDKYAEFISILSKHKFRILEQKEIGRTFEMKRWQIKKEIKC